MRFQRIPLNQQLQQLRDGIPAHPEFNACAIRAWAGTSLKEYFGSAETERKRLAELIGIPPGEEEGMIYREAAAMVWILGRQGKQADAEAAAALLAAPFIRFHEKKEGKYGESTADTA